MEKRETSYDTVEDACEAIEKIADSCSIIYSCNVIASDCRIDTRKVLQDIGELKDAKLLRYCTEENPYTYYFAFRERGCEGGSDIDYVKERSHVLGKPFIVARLSVIDKIGVKVTFTM